MRVAVLMLALTVLGAAVAAQGTDIRFGGAPQDPSAPVEVEADSLSVDQAAGTAEYLGDVVIRQGAIRLTAPAVLVIFAEDGGRIDRMQATGGVTLVSGDEAAEAERADYVIDSGTVTLMGSVLLSQGSSAIAAERMVVNLADGTASMEGRVRTLIQPGASE